MFPSPKNRLDVFRPPVQCLTHLPFVLRSVVNARDASSVAAYVIEDGFDNVRWDAEFGNHGRGGAPKIMQSPIRYAVEPAIKGGLAIAPVPVSMFAAAEHNLSAARLTFQDRPRLSGQGKFVLAVVLRSGRWQDN